MALPYSGKANLKEAEPAAGKIRRIQPTNTLWRGSGCALHPRTLTLSCRTVANRLDGDDVSRFHARA